MKHLCFALFFVVLIFCGVSIADQVTLSNGDKLSGTIVRSDGKTLVIKTEFEGEVTLQWSAVQTITSSQDLHFELKDGRSVVGSVGSDENKVLVSTKTGGKVEVPKDEISLIRNDAEQLTYDKSLNPAFREGWVGGVNVGFALTRGNSQTKNLAIAFNADRKTLHDKLKLYTNNVYATNDAPGASPSTTANAIQGGIRYDHDLTPRLFAYVGADFQADSLQTLNLRSVLGGGFGFHVVKSESTTLDLLGGINYTRENYEAFSRSFAGASLGEEFEHKLRASTVLNQSLYFYPNLTNAGDYRTTFNIGTVTKLSKSLGWQNAFGDIYVSNPPVGKKKNDLLFTTGLNVSFTH